MKIVSLEKSRKKRDEQRHQKDLEAASFTANVWNIAVDHERYLPRKLAIKLIHQIMMDHGIEVREMTEGL